MRVNTAAVAVILMLTSFVSAGAEEPAAAPRSGPAPGVAMNDFYLDQALRGLTAEVQGGDGRWQFTLFDVDLIVISDEAAGRMRAIAPVAGTGTLDREQLRLLIEVNFDRVLDAKYAIWQETVWATFVHPLSTLTPAELEAGIKQVISLARTYGTEYTSTGMVFGQAADDR